MGCAGLIGRKSASLADLPTCRADRNSVADRFAAICWDRGLLRQSCPHGQNGAASAMSGKTVQWTDAARVKKVSGIRAGNGPTGFTYTPTP
jgi:hypothetical protein